MSQTDGATITATFESRRGAELAVEHLVQELGIDRSDIFVAADGDENSAGEVISGADVEDGDVEAETESDAAIEGPITISIDVRDEVQISEVRSALEELDGDDIAVE